jgi:hypothetical protein
MSTDWGTIISIAGAGGSITLLGKEEPSGKWVFRKDVYDIFIDELDNEPSPVGEIRTFKSSISHQASVADSWEKGLKLIEQYPWKMLHPLKQMFTNSMDLFIKSAAKTVPGLQA